MSIKTKERFSLEGWNFWAWFKGNAKTIKEFAKVGIPYIISLGLFGGNVGYEGAFTLIGKLILDVCDFALQEKEIA
jgi:hypothetical protein